jgi:hypothetical protein
MKIPDIFSNYGRSRPFCKGSSRRPKAHRFAGQEFKPVLSANLLSDRSDKSDASDRIQRFFCRARYQSTKRGSPSANEVRGL